MSSRAIEQVLASVLESGSIDTIERISLRDADFSSDKACTLLIQLIDRATMLHECKLNKKYEEMKVKVTLQVDATETGGEPGKIQVINKETEEVILEMPTSRKTKVYI